MSDKRRETMCRLNKDPEFAARRNARSRRRFTDHNEHLQKLANIAKRGCDVPAWQEGEWKALKQMKITNREAARMLGIPWLGDPDDQVDTCWATQRACRIVDDWIDRIETEGGINPDLACDLIEMGKRIKRILVWNTDSERGR